MNKNTLNKHRLKLLETRRSLMGDVDTRRRETQEIGDDGMPDIADQATGINTRQILIGLGEKERAQLKLVEIALEKITNKTFGICEGCESKIPAKRLSAMPYARLCIDCQSEAERKPNITH